MEQSIIDGFKEYFSVKVANTEDLKRKVYNIRHQVYCEELKWEPERENRLETDKYDSISTHLLLNHLPTGGYAGTARLVIPRNLDDAFMPFESYCLDKVDPELIDYPSISRMKTSEISRLAVPPDFRRRKGEQNVPFFIDDKSTNYFFTDEDRRLFPNITVGLYLGIIAVAKYYQHSHMFIVVETRLQKRLGRLGFVFKPCSQPFELNGTRALYCMVEASFLTQLSDNLLELYEWVEKSVHKQLKQAEQ